MRRYTIGPALAMAATLFGTLCTIAEPGGQGIRRETHLAEVSLTRYSVSWADYPEVAFSSDSSFACVWWGLRGPPPGEPGRFLLFNRAGTKVAAWSDTNSIDRLRDFPAVAWRWTRRSFAGFAPVSFSRDLSKGLRIIPSSDGSGGLVTEMWELSQPARLLWRHQLCSQDEIGQVQPEIVGLLHDWPDDPLFVKLNGHTCAELDPKDGRVKRTFTFGPIESWEQARERVRRFQGPTNAFGWFSASSCDYDSTHGHIACGCSEDKRLRVIDPAAPDRVIFEAHSDENPFKPWGGSWSVGPVQFFAAGKYLVGSIEFERRFGPYKHEIEVYDTSCWRLVWRTADNRASSFALSPDGRTMAYIRKNTLVIGAFEPAPSEKEKPLR